MGRYPASGRCAVPGPRIGRRPRGARAGRHGGSHAQPQIGAAVGRSAPARVPRPRARRRPGPLPARRARDRGRHDHAGGAHGPPRGARPAPARRSSRRRTISRCAAQHFHEGRGRQPRIVAHGPASLVLEHDVLAATYGGHMLVLSAAARSSSTTPITTTRQPGEPHYHDEELAPMIDALLDPLGLRVLRARPRGGGRRRDRVRGDGHVRRPAAGSRSSATRSATRRSRRRHRVPARRARSTSVAAVAAVGDGARDRLA